VPGRNTHWRTAAAQRLIGRNHPRLVESEHVHALPRRAASGGRCNLLPAASLQVSLTRT
jgi:hypothetical protein